MPAAASPRGIAKRRQAIAENALKIAEDRQAIAEDTLKTEHRVAKEASAAPSAAIPTGPNVEPSLVPKEPALVLKEQRE